MKLIILLTAFLLSLGANCQILTLREEKILSNSGRFGISTLLWLNQKKALKKAQVRELTIEEYDQKRGIPSTRKIIEYNKINNLIKSQYQFNRSNSIKEFKYDIDNRVTEELITNKDGNFGLTIPRAVLNAFSDSEIEPDKIKYSYDDKGKIIKKAMCESNDCEIDVYKYLSKEKTFVYLYDKNKNLRKTKIRLTNPEEEINIESYTASKTINKEVVKMISHSGLVEVKEYTYYNLNTNQENEIIENKKLRSRTETVTLYKHKGLIKKVKKLTQNFSFQRKENNNYIFTEIWEYFYNKKGLIEGIVNYRDGYIGYVKIKYMYGFSNKKSTYSKSTLNRKFPDVLSLWE